MSTRTRLGIAAGILAAVAFLLANHDADGCFRRRVYVVSCPPIIVQAASEPVKPAPQPVKEPTIEVSKDLRVNVKNIADLIKRGKDAEATKLAKLAAKDIEDLADLMQLYRPRNKGGLGVKIGPNSANDAYLIAAMAELTLAKMPLKDGAGKRSAKFWRENASSLREASIDLVKAAANKDANSASRAANKMNAACNTCHSVFKE